MFPTIQLGPWLLPTYSSAYALGLMVAGMLAFHRMRRLPELPAHTMAVLLAAIAGGLAGTYLIAVIPTLQRFAETGQFLWIGRASFVGTLAGGTLAAFPVMRRGQSPVGRQLDLGGLPWSLLLAIGRIGCLGVGCCGGRPTDTWLALWLPDEAGRWAMRYPLQVMSGVANLLIFGILLALERHGQRRVGKDRGWPFDGFLFALYIGLFCLERFSMEWLRADSVPLLGRLSWVHLATLAGMGAVLIFMARHVRPGAGERAESWLNA